MYPTLFQYLLNLLAFLLFSYAVGKLFLNLTTLNESRSGYFQIFLSLTIGFLAISATIAAFATGFKTVLLFYFLLPGALYYWYRKPQFSFKALFHQFFPKELLVILCGALLLYTSAFSALKADSPLGFVFPWRDTINYAALSNLLYNTGIESFYVAASLTNKLSRPVPYHYFELWLNAGISEILGGLYMHNFTLVMAVGLRVAIFTGLLAIWQLIFNKVNLAGIIICFLLLFLKGIFLPLYADLSLLILEHYPGFGYVEVLDQLSLNTEGIKFLPGYLFFVAFVVCALRKDFLLSVLFILAFPVAHIVAFPGIFSALAGLMLVYFLFFRKRYALPQKTLARILITLAGFLVFIAGFYLFFGGKSEGSNSQNIFLVLKSLDLNQLQAMLIRFGHYGIKFLLVTWPYMLVLVPALLLTRSRFLNPEHKASLTFIFLFAVFALLTGAMLGGVLHQNFESHQLLQILVPVLNVSLCLLLILALKRAAASQQQVIFYMVSGSVLLLLFLSQNPVSIFYPPGRAYARNFPYDHYSDEYLQQVKQLFGENKNLNPVGSCILGPKDLNYYYAYSPFYYTLGLYLPYLRNDTFVFSLSEFYTPIPAGAEQAKRARDLTAAGAFYQFVMQQKAEKTFVSIPQSQVNFIEKHKIQYVIISPDAPENPLLEQKIKKSITDSATGERLVILTDGIE